MNSSPNVLVLDFVLYNYQKLNIITILLLCISTFLHPINAHIRLTYPPARSYSFDFLDNVRTSGPCGITQKTGPVTNFVPGSTINITWHLGYPHQGGYRIELINSENRIVQLLAPEYSNTSFVRPVHYTTQWHLVTLPTDINCENCFIRLLRQAKEWTAAESNGYLFWSCADVSIKPGLDPCIPHGKHIDGKCTCNAKYFGTYCENYNDCEKDEDCKNGGKCVDVVATTFPSKVCFCKWGYLGIDCSKKSSLETWDFNPAIYNHRGLVTNPGSELNMYWKILKDTNEIEIVLKSNSTNWLGIGWRPNNLRSKCQHYPVNLGTGGDPIYPPIDKAIVIPDEAIMSTHNSIPVAETSLVPAAEHPVVVSDSMTPDVLLIHSTPIPNPENGPTTMTTTRSEISVQGSSMNTPGSPQPETANTNPVMEKVTGMIDLVKTAFTNTVLQQATTLPTVLARRKRQNEDSQASNGIPLRVLDIAHVMKEMSIQPNVPVPTLVPTPSNNPGLSSIRTNDTTPSNHAEISSGNTKSLKRESPSTSEINPVTLTTSNSIILSNNNLQLNNSSIVGLPSAEQTTSTITGAKFVFISTGLIPKPEDGNAPVAETVSGLRTSKPEPESVNTPIAETAVPLAEGGTPVAETVPQLAAKPEPESVNTPKAETSIPLAEGGTPVAEIASLRKPPVLTNVPVSEEDLNNIATKGDAIHAMDCLDVVIAMVSPDGYYTKIDDFYSRDRSTPMVDTTFGGRNDVTAVLGYQKNGQTTIIFRKKLMSSDLADHTIIDDIMHVAWARGQNIKAPIHNPPSGIEIGTDLDKRFYRDNELKYHGTSPIQRGYEALNFYEKLATKSNTLTTGQTGGVLPFGMNACGDMIAWKYPIDCQPSKMDCIYEAYWDFDKPSELINFKIIARNSTNKWTGIGFSKGRKMPNTDVIYGWINPNDKTKNILFDGWITGYSPPLVDAQQDITNTNPLGDNSKAVEDGTTVLTFSRKRNTGDLSNDAQFTDTDCFYLFFPYESAEWNPDRTIKKHIKPPFITTTPVCIRYCNAASASGVGNGTSGDVKIPLNMVGSAFDLTFKTEMDWKPVYDDMKNPETQILLNDIRGNIREATKNSNGLADITINKLREGSVIVDAKIATATGDAPTVNYIKEALINSSTTGLIGSMHVVPNIIDIKQAGCYGQGVYYTSGDSFKIENKAEQEACFSCVCRESQLVECQPAKCENPLLSSLMVPNSSSNNINRTELSANEAAVVTTASNDANPKKNSISSSASDRIRLFFESYWANRMFAIITLITISLLNYLVV